MNMEVKNAIVIFEDLPIRKIEKAGEIWISALDVAKALDYNNPAQDVNSIISNYKARFTGKVKALPLETAGGRQKGKYFNLGGVIAFCQISKKPKALPFQEWADKVIAKELKNIPSDIRLIAKRKRVEFTDTLRDHGYKKRKEYMTTTVEMKGALGIDKYKKKDECDLIEVMKIATAEMLAKTKLMISEASGFEDVHPVCVDSAKVIDYNTKKTKAVNYD